MPDERGIFPSDEADLTAMCAGGTHRRPSRRRDGVLDVRKGPDAVGTALAPSERFATIKGPPQKRPLLLWGEEVQRSEQALPLDSLGPPQKRPLLLWGEEVQRSEQALPFAARRAIRSLHRRGGRYEACTDEPQARLRNKSAKYGGKRPAQAAFNGYENRL